MEPPPLIATAIESDLPEPTSYRGQHIIALDVDSDAWLTAYGIVYWLTPFTASESQEGSCAISLISPSELPLTCAIYAENGDLISQWDNFPDGSNPEAKSTGITLSELENPADPSDQNGPRVDVVSGTSLTFRLNYRDSVNVADVVVALQLGEPVSRALNKRRLCFRLSSRPIASTALVEQDRLRPEPKTPLIYLHAYEDPDTGAETIGTRLPPMALTHDRIAAAWETAMATGHFDPAMFPNVATGTANLDDAGRAGVMRAIAGLDTATVIQQLDSGARLTVNRDSNGDYSYRFLPAPRHCAPGLLLVEYYRLSTFPGRYGAGRTVKTFSLLPGEQTTIRISTYKRSSESLQQTSSILDATTSETESEFGRTVNSEQSNQDNASKSFEYRAEAEAQGQANWGWGSASAKVSGGVSGGSQSARQELSKNLTNAVTQNTARASSRRDVQVDTSLDVKLESGEEQAVDRTLSNINVSRTLNFVFRQMNQEFISLLHLVDVRVAFFNGHTESRDEVPLSELDRLLADSLQPDHIAPVREGILAELRTIVDHSGRPQPDFIKTVQLTGADGRPSTGYAQVDRDFTTSCTGPDGRERTVPGIIIAADRHVLRTDGITVDSYTGGGSALDDYSSGLQEQAVRAQQLENDRRQAETERLRLALQLVRKGDAAAVDLYQRVFPLPQVINQIDHAAVNTTSNGQAPPAPANDTQV
jgi:hypothetical protein